LDVAKWSNSEIIAWVEGFREAEKDSRAHSTDLPGAGGNPPPEEGNPISRYLDA